MRIGCGGLEQEKKRRKKKEKEKKTHKTALNQTGSAGERQKVIFLLIRFHRWERFIRYISIAMHGQEMKAELRSCVKVEVAVLGSRS